jgi:hypothetical protein
MGYVTLRTTTPGCALEWAGSRDRERERPVGDQARDARNGRGPAAPFSYEQGSHASDSLAGATPLATSSHAVADRGPYRSRRGAITRGV